MQALAQLTDDCNNYAIVLSIYVSNAHGFKFIKNLIQEPTVRVFRTVQKEGNISAIQAKEKALSEYKKYKAKTLSSVKGII